MTEIKYPLCKSSWGKEELQAILEVITSDRYSMGSKVAEFEKAFAIAMKTKYAVMVNSGSSANLLMVAALMFRKNGPKLKRGDVVVVPAVSWATTYYPLAQYGLKMRFVDVDLSTLNFSLSGLEAALQQEPKPKAVMAVNLLGLSNEYDRIQNMLPKDCILLEDNCESMGAQYGSIGNQKFTGTFGLMGSFSTFYSHHISTMEGGVVVTEDEELYHILLSLRAHGWTRNLPQENLVTGTKSTDPFEESYKFVLPGYNVRPVEMSGAIGIEQLKRLGKLVSVRQTNHEHLAVIFTGYGLHEYFILQNSWIKNDSLNASRHLPSWFGFSIICRPGKVERSVVIKALQEAGIECRPIVAGNFARNPVMEHMDYELPPNGLPNADIVHSNGFFVGNDGIPLMHEIRLLAETLKKVVKK